MPKTLASSLTVSCAEPPRAGSCGEPACLPMVFLSQTVLPPSGRSDRRRNAMGRAPATQEGVAGRLVDGDIAGGVVVTDGDRATGVVQLVVGSVEGAEGTVVLGPGAVKGDLERVVACRQFGALLPQLV